MSKPKISSEALEILSRLDEDGESVSGPLVVETLKSLQVEAGLV